MIWPAIALCFGFVASTPQPAWTANVGEYRLVKWVSPSRDRHTLYMKDSRGRVVTGMTDFHVGLLGDLWSERPVKTVDVNKDGVPEIIFETWSGGAHGSNSYFIWSLGKTPKCLLAYDKNNIGDRRDFELLDLDGDGVKEVRSWYDGFAYTVGGSYWKDLPIVLKLERGRYVDRTTSFRNVLLAAERNQWKDLMTSDRKLDPGMYGGSSCAAVNLIALADLLRHRSKTWDRLTHLLPKQNITWLRKREPAILNIIRRRGERYAFPSAYRAEPFKFRPVLDRQYWPD